MKIEIGSRNSPTGVYMAREHGPRSAWGADVWSQRFSLHGARWKMPILVPWRPGESLN